MTRPCGRTRRPWSPPRTATAPGERAHRAAFSALKHTHEKVGDHWEPKDEPGPSDAQAEQKGSDSLRAAEGDGRGGSTRTPPRRICCDVAKKLGVNRGVSRMRKDELVDEIRKANARATRKARS